MRAPTRLLAAVACALALTGCTPVGSESVVVTPTAQPVYPEFTTNPDVPVFDDIAYGPLDRQVLDVCVPPGPASAEPRPVIVSIHGGSWMRGDKANLNWRAVCQWFASEGFVAVSVNYRLAPEHTFPAQLDDVALAVQWLRQPEQVDGYRIDPDRIGAFGGSAGGNLAALLGTTGSGDWVTGSRVAAVAELSGPVDLREPIAATDTDNQDFADVQRAYLGCADLAECPAAALASPVTLVDETDPPFFVAHAIDEFIPLSQSDALVAALRQASVPTTYVTVEGALHSLGLLDADMQQRVIAFFRDTLQLNPVTRVNPE